MEVKWKLVDMEFYPETGEKVLVTVDHYIDSRVASKYVSLAKYKGNGEWIGVQFGDKVTAWTNLPRPA